MAPSQSKSTANIVFFSFMYKFFPPCKQIGYKINEIFNYI